MDVKGTTKSGFLDLEKGTASESSELCTDHTEMSHQYLHQETQFLTCDESTICGGSGGDIYDVVGAGSTPPSRTVNPFSSSSALNANQAVETQTRETRHFIDEIDHKNSGGYGAETERFSMNSSSSGGLWMGGSAPGGPLAEALCLGIASSSSNNSKCSSSGDGDQLGSNSIN
ncbi:hypothetical protein HS088_TW15G00446 [Tripterygium wilfordii]|uniref:Uncharacterized protein n=1 Tax=Tripterygium wilfordii TaxID=458696 RepID=A0A7J7CLM4_TRIWF|nr:hypothetical protein HS088_TW15G00446 [Tripterygium wilfordii]